MDGSSVLRTENKKNTWNCVVTWEYCLLVDEHVLKAILNLSADRVA